MIGSTEVGQLIALSSIGSDGVAAIVQARFDSYNLGLTGGGLEDAAVSVRPWAFRLGSGVELLAIDHFSTSRVAALAKSTTIIRLFVHLRHSQADFTLLAALSQAFDGDSDAFPALQTLFIRASAGCGYRDGDSSLIEDELEGLGCAVAVLEAKVSALEERRKCAAGELWQRRPTPTELSSSMGGILRPDTWTYVRIAGRELC